MRYGVNFCSAVILAFYHFFQQSFHVTKFDEIAPFFQSSVVYYILSMPKTLWSDLWGYFKVLSEKNDRKRPFYSILVRFLTCWQQPSNCSHFPHSFWLSSSQCRFSHQIAQFGRWQPPLVHCHRSHIQCPNFGQCSPRLKMGPHNISGSTLIKNKAITFFGKGV